MSSSTEDLTTDACPSPPRDDAGQRSKSEEETTYAEMGPTKENARSFTGSATYKVPPKPRKAANTAFASVINISNSNGIHIGSNYNVFVNNKREQNKQQYVVTEAIKVLFANTSTATTDDISFVATHMDESWRDTARSLDYSDGQISQFYESHIHSGIKEVIYQFLLDWIQNEADKATVAKLSNTLWETNQRDVVFRWSQKY